MSDTANKPPSEPQIKFPVFPPGFHFSTLDEACKLTLLRSPQPPSTPITSGPLTLLPLAAAYFSAFLPRDWCIGFVPHGGYLSSLLTRAGLEFLRLLPTESWGTTLTPSFRKALSQHIHPLKFQVEFLRRALSDSTCTIRVQATKLGVSYSVLSLSLYQLTPNTTPPLHYECCTGYFTYTNIPLSEPISTSPTVLLPHEYSIPPLSLCTPIISNSTNTRWRVCFKKLIYHIPPTFTQNLSLGLVEQWVRWADYPQRRVGFFPHDMGYICDMYIPPMEALLQANGFGKGTRWYPTLGYEVELKSLPGDEGLGWEWLFMRVESRGVRGGRLDVRVQVWGSEDGKGEGEMVLVARGSQVCLALSGEKNAKGRGEKNSLEDVLMCGVLQEVDRREDSRKVV
ncbi:thioesterase-like superfamily-domain-containing protein [Tirmania nivea]|nr:thioesterase-like superfamily-domain-containing protein [Tirmania nivea]